MALLDDGLMAIVDQRQNTVWIVSKMGDLVTQIGREGQGPGEFTWPLYVAYDPESRLLWVSDSGRIQAFKRDGFAFSHMLRPTVASLSGIVAVDEKLYISGYSASTQELLFIYASDGEFQGTMGIHVERDVGRRGRSIHKSGGLTGIHTSDGILLFCFIYKYFNDILLIRNGSQNLIHAIDSVLVEKDEENRRRAKNWPDRREGPIPHHIIDNPFLLDESLFLMEVSGNNQQGTRILEMDQAGSIQRIWLIPSEYTPESL